MYVYCHSRSYYQADSSIHYQAGGQPLCVSPIHIHVHVHVPVHGYVHVHVHVPVHGYVHVHVSSVFSTSFPPPHATSQVGSSGVWCAGDC